MTRGALRGPGRCPRMRTALVVLIMLARFGPDFVYAASDSGDNGTMFAYRWRTP